MQLPPDNAPHGYPPPPQPGSPWGYGAPPPPPSQGPVLVWIFVGIGVLFFFGILVAGVVGVAVFRASARSAPVAEAPAETAAPELPTPRRDVPVHDASLLTGCSATDLETIERGIGAAIDIGAPTYNRGDFQGCYTTYERAARNIEATLPASCKGPAGALAKGRSKAATLSQPADRAWAMRDAFDGLLDVIEHAQ